MTDRPGAFTPPTEFAEYRLVRLLGRGTMGQVFLAEDLLLGRPVAIKFVSAGDGSEPDAGQRERFFVEARAIARLQHRGVVAIFRVGELRGRPYLVSEFVRGQTLDRLPKPQPSARVVDIGQALARGLAAAHRAGVLHRDIKPANSILADDGEAKLLDFGLAKLLDPAAPPPFGPPPSRPSATPPWRPASDGEATLDGPRGEARSRGDRIAPAPSFGTATADLPTSGPGEGLTPTVRAELAAGKPSTRGAADGALTQAGALVGSPLYMAPEIWRGEPATRASDLYSLGVLLFELAVGHAPHDEVPLARLGEVVQSVDAWPPGDRSEVDPRLASIIARCLARDPLARFAGADELAEALAQAALDPTAPPIGDGDPYLGLRPFAAGDRGFFFGRDADVRAILDRLANSSFVLVAGDSGVGKSSLCAAGVLPRLEERGLRTGGGNPMTVVRLVPGRRPLHALAGAFASLLDLDEESLLARLREEPRALAWELRRARRGEWVVFVDQLEELLTIAEADEATRAAAGLAGLAAMVPGLRLLATARGDFLARLATLPSLGEELTASLYLLRPLSRAGLAEAIVGPARVKGARFESEALVERLVNAAEGSGGLPLLQFALAALWEARDRASGIILERSLEAIGGVEGALAGHADRLFAELMPGARERARGILLALVSPEGTRARRSAEELDAPAAGSGALEALVRGRLVVAQAPAGDDGEVTYEIAHEALLRSWDTLRGWLGHDAERRALRQRLGRAATEWQRLGAPPELLWSERQLAELGGLLDDDAEGSPLHREFVERSRGASRRRRWRRLGAAITVPLVVVVALLGARLQSRRELTRRVDGHLTIGRDLLGAAQRRGAEVRGLRGQAFAAFDARRDEAGEQLWTRALAAAADEDRLLARATQSLEAGLLADGGRADLRAALAETLLARTLVAERDHRALQGEELVERLRAYDDGSRLARLHAPARLTVTSRPTAATVTLLRYRVEDGRLVAATPRPLGRTPIDGVTLDPGSYLARFELPDRPPAGLPILVERGEARHVEVALPRRLPAGYVHVPGGRFLFGADDDEVLRRALLAQPQHPVESAPFLIGRHEVTFGDWIAFLEDLPPGERTAHLPRGRDRSVVLDQLTDGRWRLEMRPPGAVVMAVGDEPARLLGRDRRVAQRWRRLPVVGVSWLDAAAYHAWLDRTGRLPGARPCTEREWEFAARGADGRRFPHGDHLAPDDANFDETYGRRLQGYGLDEAGAHPRSASPFGLEDAAGNVWEGTQAMSGADAIVNRGGSWYQDAWSARSDQRDPGEPTQRTLRLGLRVCAPVPPVD